MSVLLSQGSEFAFVIFAMALVQHELGQQYSAVLIIAVAMSMMLTPVLVGFSRKLVKRWVNKEWDKSQQPQAHTQSGEVPIIIVGMGDVGRCIANGLDAQGIAYRGIEVNHDCFVGACSSGYTVGFGDATDLRLMETIKMAHAKIIAITFADYEITKQLAPIVQQSYTDLTLMVAVSNEKDKERFDDLGLLAVVQHSFPRGLDMASAVLNEHGVSPEKIQKWMQTQQNQELDTASVFDKEVTLGSK